MTTSSLPSGQRKTRRPCCLPSLPTKYEFGGTGASEEIRKRPWTCAPGHESRPVLQIVDERRTSSRGPVCGSSRPSDHRDSGTGPLGGRTRRPGARSPANRWGEDLVRSRQRARLLDRSLTGPSPLVPDLGARPHNSGPSSSSQLGPFQEDRSSHHPMGSSCLRSEPGRPAMLGTIDRSSGRAIPEIDVLEPLPLWLPAVLP